MNIYTQEELNKILEKHQKWLNGDGGSRANLSNSDLSYANLSNSDLSYANLSNSDLRNANLSNSDLRNANLYKIAQLSFNFHGECGRQLLAIQYKKDDEIIFQCGCFKGSKSDLVKYIKEGDEKYKKSRTLALKTIIKLMEFDK